MAFGLILLIIQIVLFVVSSFLNKPDVENAKPAGLGDFQVPTASEARAVPILWGTRDIKGPNVIWYGDLKIVKITKRVKSGFSKKKITVGFRYFIGMDLLLCYGLIDRVVRLEVSDRVAFTGSVGPFVDAPSPLVVNAPTLLGGQEMGGGVAGTFDIFGGTPTQDRSSYLINSGPGLGDPLEIPAYVDIAHAVARQIEVGESPNIGAYVFRVSRFPDNLGLTGSNHIVTGTVDDGDANPAEAIFEILTSEVFGLSFDISKIDQASFIAAGNTLATEGLGISLMTDRIQHAKEVLKNILQYIDGVLYEDSDGVFTLKLIRDDFGAVGSLELYDETNVVEVRTFSRGSWSETNNHVNIKYTDRLQDNIETGAMAQDLANFRTTNKENRIDIAMPAAPEKNAARIVAERELLQLSFPLAKVTLDVNRDGQKIRPGDAIRWSWAEYGVTDMVLRVLSVELGELLNGTVTLQCVQDIFRIAETIYGNPDDTGWIPIDTDAIAFVDEIVRAVPRIYHNLTFANIGELDPALGQRIHSMAKRPSGVVATFQQFVDLGLGAGFEGEIGDSDSVTPAGTLSAAYSEGTAVIDVTGFTLNAFQGVENLEALTDGSQVLSGLNLALIEGSQADGSEDEIIAWEGFTDNGDGTVDFTSIHRGLMDTVARSHASGARVFLFFDGQAISDQVYGITQAITVRHQARTTSDVLDISTATSRALTFPDRLRRPHHPANVTVDATRVPQAADETADLDFDWLHRTNDEVVIRDGNVGSPNAQDTEVEYDLEFQHAVTGAVLRTETRVSPAPNWLTFLYTQALLQSDTGEVGDFPLRVLMQARYASGATNNPANLTSLQQSSNRFSTDMGGSVLRSVNLNGTDEFIRTNSATRGFADAFSWEIWVNWNALGNGAETICWFKPNSGNASRIELRVAAATASSVFNIRVWNSGGTIIKDFDFGSIPAASTWTQLGITFDGGVTDDPLIVIQDGADVTSGATKTTDNTGAQTNATGRYAGGVDTGLAAGFLDAALWRWGVWNVALSVAEFAALYNSGTGSGVNPRFDFGNYAGMDENMHLWDFRDTGSPGQDFGNDSPDVTGALIDIFTAGQNVTAADLIADTP